MELSGEERDLHRSNEQLTPQSHLFRLQRRIEMCVWERFFKKEMHFPCTVKDTIGKYSLKWWSLVVKAQINLPLPKESTNNHHVCGEQKFRILNAAGQFDLWHLLLTPSWVLEVWKWREETLLYFLKAQCLPSSTAHSSYSLFLLCPSSTF